MFRLPAISERSGRFLIAILLFIKLVLLPWNALVYDGRTYDADHHSDRALFAGLRPGKLAYDPPLYYLPLKLVPRPDGVPLLERSSPEAARDEAETAAAGKRQPRQSKAERSFRAHLLELLRYGNVPLVGFFYLAWIGYAFPRLLGWGQRWFLASLLLLALPGYQKLAAMSHPENLFVATSALAVCCWLWLRRRWLAAAAGDTAAENEGGALKTSWLVLFAVAVGLVGLTRPMAIVPVAVLTGVALVYAARSAGGRVQRFLARAALVIVVVGVLSGGWYWLRWQRTGAVLAFKHDDVAAQYEPRRAGFSYAHYFTSFHARPLLDIPNTSMSDEAPSPDKGAPRANSFFTLLYSDVWGDHWLSFSGPKHKELKSWPKRMSLACGLLLPTLIGLLGAFWIWDFTARARATWRASSGRWSARAARFGAELETELVLLAWSALGGALFVYWQAGPALLPGDNYSLKFIHIATLFPPAIALLFSRPLKPTSATLLAAYLLLLFMAAFPVAMYWPG
jgi:hypothetical protein